MTLMMKIYVDSDGQRLWLTKIKLGLDENKKKRLTKTWRHVADENIHVQLAWRRRYVVEQWVVDLGKNFAWMQVDDGTRTYCCDEQTSKKKMQNAWWWEYGVQDAPGPHDDGLQHNVSNWMMEHRSMDCVDESVGRVRACALMATWSLWWASAEAQYICVDGLKTRVEAEGVSEEKKERWRWKSAAAAAGGEKKLGHKI
jgi:hypothetical protein